MLRPNEAGGAENVLTPAVMEKGGCRKQRAGSKRTAEHFLLSAVSANLLDPCEGLSSLILDLFPSFLTSPSAAPRRGY